MVQRALLLILMSACCYAQSARAPLKMPARPNANLYRADVDANAEIQRAIAEARLHNRNVLLVFGANWCGDCYALDYAFHQPRIKPLLDAGFKVVHIDVGEYNRNLDVAKKYHIPLEKGVPSVAVLDPSGKLLYSSSEFEKARLMTEEDVISFLETWKPKSQPVQR